MGASAGIGADCAGRDVVVATGCAEVSTDEAAPEDSVGTAGVEGVAGVEKPDLWEYFSSVGHQLGSTEFLSTRYFS